MKSLHAVRLSARILACTAALLPWIEPSRLPAQVLIHEILASNGSHGQDADGNFEDWIELHNPGTAPVALGGYSLSDDAANPVRWILPATTIQPGGFLIVWASGKDRRDPAELHTNFRLAADGELVNLFTPEGMLADGIVFGPQRRDTSFGRRPGALDEWVFFLDPSPGAPNATVGYPEIPSVTVDFAPGGGFFRSRVLVALSASPAESEIFYTLDGSAPDPVSTPLYGGPLEITGTQVLRATAYLDGRPLTVPDGRTYLLGQTARLPVVSVSAAPGDLWSSETGILAHPAQSGPDWERPGFAELYSPAGERGFGTACGLRVHGGASRLNSAKHSLRLYFRSRYGLDWLEAEIFDPLAAAGLVPPAARFDSLILRAGYHDSWLHFSELQRRHSVYFRDQLVRDLHLEMGQPGSRGTWMSLYLNGEYYGLYNLTERIDSDFLETYLGGAEWDVVKEDGVREGDRVAWDEFLAFMMGSNLADPLVYQAALERIDIENFLSYIVLNVWAANRDWPQRNWYAVRRRGDPQARWLFLCWDAEQTFADNLEPLRWDQDTLQTIRSMNGPISSILESLLKNVAFRQDLLRAFERHLRETLDPDRVIARVDALEARIQAEIPHEATRWGGGTLDRWRAAVSRLREFVRGRGPTLFELVRPALSTASDPPYPLPAPLPSGTRAAFIVRDPLSLGPGNTAVRGRLEARGASVDVFAATQDDAIAIAASYDLVLISSDVRGSDVGSSYRQLSIPHLFWDPELLSLSGEPLASGGTVLASQTRIRTLLSDHPILRYVPRNTLIRLTTSPRSFSAGTGPRGPGVELLATSEDGSGYALLAAESGAELAGGLRTRARTVFLGMGDDAFLHANGHLARIFDQAVDWILGIAQGPEDRRFLRADVNGEGRVDISDAVALIAHLFGGTVATTCEDAADADDSGIVDITDAIYILEFLFRAGPFPRPPYPTPDFDPSADTLSCPAAG